MAPKVRYQAETLKDLLLEQSIATIDELKAALGTATDLTVLRKLKEMGYHTSYSHRGKYYTLSEIARFDELGLWSFNTVWFSRHGTLIKTVEVLVETSDSGYYASELECILQVSVKDALRKLYEQKILSREKINSRYLYLSADPYRREKQLTCRANEEDDGEDVFPDELKAAVVIFFSLLDERKRRLYAGLESLRWGHGGDRRIASLLGLDEKTVAKGRRELLSEDFDYAGVRRPGGGRRPLKKGLRK